LTGRSARRAALCAAGLALLAGGAAWLLATGTREATGAESSVSPERTAVPDGALADLPAEPPQPAAAGDEPAVLPRAALEEWVAGLAQELVREPFQPRVYQQRLEACLAGWTPELRAEFEAWREAPPAAAADFVVLASLGRALALPLAPLQAARLRALAAREDVAFGVALESARALVAAGGSAELGWWCAALEGARDARALAIASGALAALHDGSAERFLIERALELGDPQVAGRLLDALGRALEGAGPWDNPARAACAGRLFEVAGDGLADAGLRARSLGVLRLLDPAAAARVAADWFLEPGAGTERLEFAAGSLHGQPAACAALRAVRAAPGLDDARAVRLAECVLFTPAESLAAEDRLGALAQMRTALRDSRDGAARRRAIHALARFGTPEDRALVEQAAESDPDPLARSAARSALQREASDWR
jgi:hypothetical protein